MVYEAAPITVRLLEFGAEREKRTLRGHTPLDIAVDNGSESILGVLLTGSLLSVSALESMMNRFIR